MVKTTWTIMSRTDTNKCAAQSWADAGGVTAFTVSCELVCEIHRWEVNKHRAASLSFTTSHYVAAESRATPSGKTRRCQIDTRLNIKPMWECFRRPDLNEHPNRSTHTTPRSYTQTHSASCQGSHKSNGPGSPPEHRLMRISNPTSRVHLSRTRT